MSKQIHTILAEMRSICPVDCDVAVRADHLRPSELRALWIFEVAFKPVHVEVAIPDSSSTPAYLVMLDDAEQLILEALS